jgi:hypothetical protein
VWRSGVSFFCGDAWMNLQSKGLESAAGVSLLMDCRMRYPVASRASGEGLADPGHRVGWRFSFERMDDWRFRGGVALRRR